MAEYPFNPIKIGNPCQTCCVLCTTQIANADPKYSNCCYENIDPKGELRCYNTKLCGVCIKINDDHNLMINNKCLDDKFRYVREGKKICLDGECYSDCWKLEDGKIVPNYNINNEICCDYSGKDNVKPKPGTAKDSCYNCGDTETGNITVPHNQDSTYNAEKIQNYCAKNTNGKTSCCWGECYDPTDNCFICDETDHIVKPKCPNDQEKKNKECCDGNCFNPDKECKICQDKTIVTNPKGKCCSINAEKDVSCDPEKPECCPGIGCFKPECQRCE